MLDKMEFVPGEVPTGPGARTNSNQAKVEQTPIIKDRMEQIDSFKDNFFCSYLLGLIGWIITLAHVLFMIGRPSNLSPICPKTAFTLQTSPYMYDPNFLFDLHAFVSENETNFDQRELIWKQSKLTYGDLQSEFNTTVSISEYTRNSSLYLHVCVTKSGFPAGPKTGDSWAELYTICRTKRMNFYHFYQEENREDFSASQVHSFWLPNWTVNLVGEGTFGFKGKEEGRIDCDPLTGKYYPLLYLNDNFNLARDCIPINQTTESLPLNLIFKQIDWSKLRDYLKQSDFEEYLRRSNRPNVEFIRENLIASDFEMTGLLHVDHFWWTMAAVLLAEKFLFVGFELIRWKAKNGAQSRVRNLKELAKLLALFVFKLPFFTVISILCNFFFMILFPMSPAIFKKYKEKEQKETVKSGDSLEEKDRVSSTEVFSKHLLNHDLDVGSFVLNALLPECLVIVRNFLALVIVPLLLLYFWFSLCHSAFSPTENLTIFTLLAIGNCYSYLNSITRNTGFLFFNYHSIYKDFAGFWSCYLFAVNFYEKLTILWLILHYFSLTDFSTPAFLVFIFAWLLSDLAFLVCWFELKSSIVKKMHS